LVHGNHSYTADKNNNNSLPDPIEEIIQRTIDGIQKLINPQHGNNNNSMTSEAEAATTGIAIILAMKDHWESQIKILRESPRDGYKLKVLLQEKQLQYEKAQDGVDIERLVAEIEMLKFVLFLVCKNM
jgi:predicted secreted Zn-dependent protease